jgi:hypothetical protein
VVRCVLGSSHALAHSIRKDGAPAYTRNAADAASKFDASLEYGDVLVRVATAAIRNLERYGVDPLDLQLCLADARRRTSAGPTVMTYVDDVNEMRQAMATLLDWHRIQSGLPTRGADLVHGNRHRNDTEDRRHSAAKTGATAPCPRRRIAAGRLGCERV